MLLHLLVLAPFVAAILMAATSKEDPKSSSRLAFLFGVAFFAMSIALVAATNVFSYFISVSSRYTTVYGSLAAVIILLVWLFLCSNIIILGNVFNYVAAEQQDQYGTIRLPHLDLKNSKK